MKRFNVMIHFKATVLAGALLFTGCQDSFFDQEPSPGSGIIDHPVDIGISVRLTTGFQGGTWERLPDNSIGPKIPGVKITFTRNDSTLTKTVYSNSSGYYKVSLPAGKYYVVATHPDFEIYNSSPGYFVVTGNDGYQTGNFFLKELTYGRQGVTFVRNYDGSIGPKLPYVKLTFTKNDGLFTKVLWSDANGHYKVSLPVGKYYLKAEKTYYATYVSNPGVSVITGNGYSTLNFFLKHARAIVIN